MCNSVNCNHGGDDDFFGGLEDDDIFAGATDKVTDKDIARANTALGMVTEPCKKCHGRGKFLSYTGRVVGDCFACKGKGTVTYKHTAEVRADRNAKAKARKARQANERAEEWAVNNPAEAAWIYNKSPTFAFAASMAEALTKYGSLTENQVAAVRRCIARDIAREEEKAAKAAEQAEREANAPTVAGLEPISVAFSKAFENGIQRPKMRLGSVKLSRAPDHGRNAGAIYVTDQATDTYLGKIAEGRFIRSRDCSDEQEAEVLAVCADPAKAATAYGQRTGRCSICGRTLTKGESIDRAIGPICAQKFGL